MLNREYGKHILNVKLSLFVKLLELYLLIYKGLENTLCMDSMKMTSRHTPINLEMNQTIYFKRQE